MPTYPFEDDSLLYKSISKKEQQAALKSILETLDASEIAIPQEKLNLFPPRAYGYYRGRESFSGKTGVAFDALSAAETAADFTLKFLLNPQRASRLVQQKSMNADALGLKEVLDELVVQTVSKSHKSNYYNEVQQNINYRVLYHIMNLAASKYVHPQVNAIAKFRLGKLAIDLEPKDDALVFEMIQRIIQFQKHPELFTPISSPKIPDGSPIGSCGF